MKTPWTLAEVNLLKENYPKCSIRILQSLLNRSITQINGKAYKLGLTKNAEYLEKERYHKDNIAKQIDYQENYPGRKKLRHFAFKKTVTKFFGDELIIRLSQGVIKNAIGKIGESIVQNSNKEVHKVLLSLALSEFELKDKKYIKFDGRLSDLLTDSISATDRIQPEGNITAKKVNEVKSYLLPKEKIEDKIESDKKSIEKYYFLAAQEIKTIISDIQEFVTTYPDDVYIFFLPCEKKVKVKFVVKYYRYKNRGKILELSSDCYMASKNFTVDIPTIDDYRIALIEVKTTIGTNQAVFTPNQIQTKYLIKSNPKIKYYLVKLNIPYTQIKFPKTLRTKISRM